MERTVVIYLLQLIVYKPKGELTMDVKELKKVLAGIGVVGLLAGGGITVPGSAGASG
jgi:radical SAM modification target selenobiotic family peptide